MSLIGSTNEEKIWNYLKAKGLPDCGIAGLMGNLYAESCLIPTNLQNSYEKALSFTDAAYTAAVDNGTYQNFVKDSAGYGLAQWTYGHIFSCVWKRLCGSERPTFVPFVWVPRFWREMPPLPEGVRLKY